jgi:hypothetical protein
MASEAGKRHSTRSQRLSVDASITDHLALERQSELRKLDRRAAVGRAAVPLDSLRMPGQPRIDLRPPVWRSASAVPSVTSPATPTTTPVPRVRIVAPARASVSAT